MKTCMRQPVTIAAIILVILFFSIAVAGCTGTLPGTPAGVPRSDNTGKLSVYFLDVGQGDSELLIFGNKTILIDAGEIDMGDRVVADLEKLGVTRIDLLVATHPHSDHIGGMQKVLARFPVGQVLDAGLPHPSPVYEQFLETIDARHIPYTVAVQGQTIDIDPALRILVLSPPAQRFGDDPNQNSVALRISYGTVDLLMTGDLGGEAEAALAKTGYPLDAEILKVGHHGSRYSTSAAFLARVHPEVAIIEDGKDNLYGHPHDETLQSLKKAGITVYRTDLDGTVLVRSDGISYSVKTENGAGNLWGPQATTVPAGNPAITIPASVSGLNVTVPTLPADLSLTLPSIPATVTVPVPSFTLPPVQIGNASSVYISATQFNAPGDDRLNLNGEWVRLTNRGTGPVLIAGWTLSDRTSSYTYRFPATILLLASSVTVYTGTGMMNDTALFMGRSEPLFGNSGDTAILRDGTGVLIDQRSGGRTT
ncbi:lamin tail domain-containing protein [uncultured Methanoregula sp.]|uniref:lamin tail domain-containing protein n=1 Tax=uncultured Methanoregula sp. TaxID=1005933 RepID=UPI002AAB3C40|nr:lamin tail domain-containing protein [uncultured Methanoregula sp.]